MAGAIADAFVNIRADTSGFAAETSRGVTSAFRGIGRSMVGLAAAWGLGDILSDTVMDASGLQESTNAVRVSFQDLGTEAVARLNELGAGAVQNMGMTQTAFNEAAVRFNAFSRNIAAGSGQDVVSVLESITGRATDFASVMNLDVAEAQRLFQSGLAGETEPLRRFGIDISAAAVETYALSEGIASNYQELSEAEKQMIRWQLILDQTSQMQGDFANTSDQLANQMRILQASVKTAGIAFGTGLLPGLQEGLKGITEFLPSLQPQLEATGKAVGSALTPVFETLGPAFLAILENITPVIEDLASVFGSLAPLLVPIINLVGTIAGLFSGVLMNALHAFNPVIETAAMFIQTLADTLGTALAPVITTITQVLYDLAPIFNEALLDILPIIIDLINELAPAFGDLIEVLAPVIALLVEGLVIALETIAPILPALVKGFVLLKIAVAAFNIISMANPWVLLAAAIVGSVIAIKAFYDRSVGFRNLVDSMWQGVQSLWQAFQNLWDVVVNKVVSIWQEHLFPILSPLRMAFEAIKDAVVQVIDVFKDFGGAIVDAFKMLFSGDFSDAFAAFKQAFIDLWDGLTDINWAGIGQRIIVALMASIRVAWDKIQSLGEWLSGIWDKFMAWVDSVDWNSVGSAILNALAAGAKFAWDALTTVVGWYANFYGKIISWITSVDWISVGEKILESIANAAKTAWNALKSVAAWFSETPIGQKVIAWVQNIKWGEVGNVILDGLATAVSAAWNALTSLATWFAGTPIGTKILNWVQNTKWGEVGAAIISGIGSAVLVAFQGVTSVATWFGDIVSKLEEWIESVNWDDVGTAVGDWVGQLPGKLFSWIASAFDRGDSGGSGKAGGANWTTVVLNMLKALGKVFLALAVTLPLEVLEALGELAWGIIKGIGDALVKDENLQPVRDWFVALPGKFVEWITDIGSGLFDLGKRIILEIAAGFAEGAGDIPGVGRLLNILGADDMAEAAREEIAKMDWEGIRDEFVDGWNSMFGNIPLNVEFGRQITIDNLVSDFQNALAPLVPIIGEDAANEISRAFNAAIPGGISNVEADSINRLLHEKLADALGVDINDIPGLEAEFQALAGGIVDTAQTAITGGFQIAGGGGGGGILQPSLSGFASSIALGIGAAFDEHVYPAMENMPKKLATAAGKEPKALQPPGKKLVTGFSDAIDTTMLTVKSTMLGLSLKLVGWIGNLSNTFTSTGVLLIDGFSRGVAVGIIPLSAALRGLSSQILLWTIGLPLTLYARGIEVMNGFASGIHAGAPSVSIALFSVSALIANWGASIGGALFWSGVSVMSGFSQGIGSGANSIYWQLIAFRNSIDNIFSGMGGILYSAGVAVMAGFEIGLRVQWASVSRFLSSAKSQIPKLKGPPSVDRVILEDAGRLVMQGFQRGLSGGWDDVTKQLQSYTSQIGMGGSSSNSMSVVVQAPNVTFAGALPTDAQAFGVGTSVGNGIADALARRRVRTLTRTGGS